jgi:hypothetical protein
MNEEMMKSLVDLIDESLAEIEELKKSDRFSASEVSLGDSASGMEGKDKNGSLDKEEAAKADEDKDEDEDSDKDKKKDDDDKGDDQDMDKADGKNLESDEAAKADEDMDKGEMMAGDSDKGSTTGGSAGTNSEGVAKSEDESKDFDDELKKSRDESETLIKSYIDDKVGGLEAKLAGIADMVRDLADSPVPSKGSSYRDVTPLQKSEPEAEVLSKAEIADKLFELKKSGEAVDSKDIVSAELGTPSELSKIVNKYNIK